MKILKSIFVVITALMVIYMIQPTSLCVAGEVKVKTFDQMYDDIKVWESHADDSKTGLTTDGMKVIIVPIINTLTAIGIIVIVAVTIIMGIKYMFATPEQAAKLKQQLIGLVVSAVVVLGATAIWKIVYTVLDKTNL